jgi:hypothetical protein
VRCQCRLYYCRLGDDTRGLHGRSLCQRRLTCFLTIRRMVSRNICAMIGEELVARYMHPTSIYDARANSKDAVAICTVFVFLWD